MKAKPSLFAITIIVSIVFTWSLINPHDYFTWFLEVLPALIGITLLVVTYKRFQFTTFVYALIGFHAIILMVGGHYTYAEVPLFNWIRATFHQARNNYDKLGHFTQGFVPAIVAREILLRQSPLHRGKWLFFIVICICLAISAMYELFEWGIAIGTGTAADAFLGTQGDPWDTQSDMAFALIGAITALGTLTTVHDKYLRRINI
jgi:putative membrane protein